MTRTIVAVAMLVAACGDRAREATTTTPEPTLDREVAAPADDAAPSAPDLAAGDAPPTDLTIAPPAELDDTPLRVAPEPAEHGWWKRKGGCGAGHRMKTVRNDRPSRSRPTWVVAHVCVASDGVEDGPHVSLYDSGQVHEEGRQVRDINHGMRRAYDPDGTLRDEIPFVDGVREGVQRHWDRDGELLSEATYRADEPDGRWWQRLDVRITTGFRVAGLGRHGTWLVHDVEGHVLARIDLDRNQVIGEPRWWYPDGSPWMRGEVEGSTARWTGYDRSGAVLVEIECDGTTLRSASAEDPDVNSMVSRMRGVCADPLDLPIPLIAAALATP